MVSHDLVYIRSERQRENGRACLSGNGTDGGGSGGRMTNNGIKLFLGAGRDLGTVQNRYLIDC